MFKLFRREPGFYPLGGQEAHDESEGEADGPGGVHADTHHPVDGDVHLRQSGRAPAGGAGRGTGHPAGPGSVLLHRRGLGGSGQTTPR